jgi:UDP-N-acetylglucosamine transferase subunit ALG13
MYMRSLRHPDFVSQTDRTLTQLRNAGGMRLITKKTTADSIIQYEDYFKKLANQQVWYEGMLKDVVNAGVPVFNYKYYPKRNEKLTKELFEAFNINTKIESPNEKLIIQLGNTTTTYRNVTGYYLALLEEGKQKSLDLIKILKNDYNIN